jgi:hypothetical protein
VSFEFRDPTAISLSGELRREQALTSILSEEPPGAPDAELLINTRHIEGHDVAAAAALRMRIARHLREHERGRVTIAPPKDPLLAARLEDVLLPLPDGAVLADAETPGPEVRYAVLPATQVTDPEAAHLAGETALEFCEALRISDERAGMIALAAMGLAEQALDAEGATDAPVIAATVSGRTRRVELAVIDSGRAISESRSAKRMLETLTAPDNGAAILPELLRVGQRHELDVSIEILAGTGRLRWRWSGHTSEEGNYFPGTCVIVSIGS